MKAGELRHRISVYQQGLVSDNAGGQVETFTLKGDCWCEIKSRYPSADDERYIDRKIKVVGTFLLKTRYNIGFAFKESDIVKFGTRLFRIHGQTNILEHNFTISVNCLEIQNDYATIV